MNPIPQPGSGDRAHGDLRASPPGWLDLPTSARWEEMVFCSQVFDAAPIMLAVLDSDLRYRAVNQAWSKAAGLSADEAVGRYIQDLHPDMDPPGWELDRRVLATGEAILDEEVTGTTPSDPSTRRVWRTSRYPLHSSTGATVAVGLAAVDVTDERRAQGERDQVDRRLRLLSRASGLLGASLDLSATLREMVALVIPEFADACELYLADEPSPAGAVPDPLILRRAVWAHSPDLPQPPPGLDLPPPGTQADLTGRQIGRAFVTRRPVRVDLDERLLNSDAQSLAALYRHFRIRSAIIVPLLVGARCLGCVSFAVTSARPYREQDMQTATELGSRIATAIANARAFDHQRTAALTLQRALMPHDVPAVRDLDLAWRYQPGTSGTEVGGDWFDVIRLRAGRVALVIGDVMGRGLNAAATMGQLRTTTRTLARLDLPPAAVLTELDAVTRSIDTIASMVYVIWDPGTRTVIMANGGHLPPALRHPGGTVELLDDDTHGIILGVTEQTFTDSRHRFPAGSTLALYTDGLVESPAVDIDEGSRRLLGILTETTDQPIPVTADRLLALLDRSDGYDDDVTLLLAHARRDHRS